MSPVWNLRQAQWCRRELQAERQWSKIDETDASDISADYY